MRRFALLCILLVAGGCNDGSIVQPKAEMSVIPGHAPSTANAFVGSWWGTDWEDASLHHVTISHENAFGDIQVNFKDDASTACDGGPMRFHAVGRIVSPNVLRIFDLVAVCPGPGKTEIPFGSGFGYQYVPAQDQLLFCQVDPVLFCVMPLTREEP